MKLSIIIVNWNTKALLQECLISLYAELRNQRFFVDSEVFVVDNHSADHSTEMVRKNFPDVLLVENFENRGFGRANNQAIELAKGEFILLLNPDTKVISGAISELLRFANTDSNIGIVAPQLLNTDGSVQRSCRAFPSIMGMFYEMSGLSKLFPNIPAFRKYKMLDFDHTSVASVDQPEGACLLVRKIALDQVGIFDENFFMLFEEVDLCYRLKKAGWGIWFNPTAKIIHHFGQSIQQVKVKMIFSSHNGMYYFWAKHNKTWYNQLLKPFLWIFLKLLAIVRVALYLVSHKFNSGKNMKHGNGVVLELGCGKGRNVNVLSKRLSSKVIGVDLSEENIKIAKINYPNLDFRVMSAENLKFADSTFDQIYAYDIYEHVDNLSKSLQETARVIKKNGKLIINVPSEKSEKWLLKIRPSYHKEIHHLRIFKGTELDESVEQLGFKMLKKKNKDFLDHIILYYMFTRTKGSYTQLGIGDWRDTWGGRILFGCHAFTKPNLVFTSFLRFIPIWIVTIPIGLVVNSLGNRIFPKSVLYEFKKL